MAILCANWKMNLSVSESATLSKEFSKLAQEAKSTQVWAAAGAAALSACVAAAKGGLLKVGAQNAYGEEKGAFTGELSSSVLHELGVEFSLVGHSERRHIFGESLGLCSHRALILLKKGISVIFCIGETLAERESGSTMEILDAQLDPLLQGLIDPSKLCLAYEPVWAIGTGLAATAEQIAEVHSQIPHLWAQRCKHPCPPILYGGSVNDKNFAEILAIPNVAGGLVGGASNSLATFQALFEIAEAESSS